MRKTIMMQLATAMIAGSAVAVSAQEAITPDVLNTLKTGYTASANEKAMRNIISANAINDLSVNQSNRAAKNTYFSNKVESSGITDQQKSGRCWLFTGTNVLRARTIKKYNQKKFQFSQVYLFFYDQLEKSNLFLQNVIDTRAKSIDDQSVRWLFQNPLSDGGTYTGVADLVEKYGIVPQEAMPETYNSNNTSSMVPMLKRKLREYGITLREQAQGGTKLAQLEKNKVEMMKTVYRLLVYAYGEPVSRFSWAPKDADGKCLEQPKEYTPKSYYEEIVKQDDLNADYVMLMNDPSREYGKVYEIDNDRHVYEGHNWLYLNLPIEDIKRAAINSIKDSTMMYFSCDVAKYLDRDKGTLDLNNFDYESLLGTQFGMSKKQRIQSFDSGSSHAMTLMAVNLDADGKPLQWEVENSWGEKSGFEGHLIITDRWFDEYVFRLVVNRKYLSQELLNLMKQKPIRLPAWDPMFNVEE